MPAHSLKKTVIIVAGPTAAGKTGIAIQLAAHFNTDIISADSRQCYKELDIGVARPSPAELREIPHHFVATHSIGDDVNAATFEQYALEKTKELFQQQDVLVMAGGTGLYIKAFCEGLDTIPSIDRAVRENILEQHREKGISWLQDQLKQKDPAFYRQGEIQNPQRMMRALEVVEATGRSILSFHGRPKAQRDFNVVKIGLELPREKLYDHINSRTNKMMGSGLLEEVKGLLPYKDLHALQTVGYSELFEYLAGHISLDKATDEIQTNTRHYAKRQMTWFKKDTSIQWFNPVEMNAMIAFTNAMVRKSV